MKKNKKMAPELLRSDMRSSDGMQSNINNDERINSANRLILEQQNIADYRKFSRTYSKKKQATKKIHSDYEKGLKKLLDPGGLKALRRISDAPTRVVLKAADKPISHKSIIKDTERLVEKKNRSYKAFLNKVGVKAKAIADIKKVHTSKIDRKLTPRMKPKRPGGSGGGSAYVNIAGYTYIGTATYALEPEWEVGREYAWNSLYYKRSFFDATSKNWVTPTPHSIPDWGVVGNHLAYQHYDTSDFDVGAGVLQNQIGEVIWVEEGQRLWVEVDMTCKIAETHIIGRDEFAISGYQIQLTSDVCVSVGNETRTDRLWDYATGANAWDYTNNIGDINTTVKGPASEEKKTVSYLFHINKTGCYIIWAGLKDSYYCVQNDYGLDLTFKNSWHINQVRVTVQKPKV